VILERLPDVQKLSANEKLLLASELWDELEANPTEVPVSAEVVEELDRRMEHFKNHPDEFTTWESVKGKLSGSRS
jgi:putative addiction module component (TIGR02574 family)